MKLLLPILLLFTAASGQWEKLPVPIDVSLRGLSAVNENIIWASGASGTIIRTIDGGKNWSVMIVPGAEKQDFRGIRAFDDKTAVIMSSGKAEDGQARIYRTADGGKSWTQVYEQKTPGIFFDAIAFWDRKHGIVLSDPIVPSDASSDAKESRFALFKTDDGGATWKQVPPAALPPALPNEGGFAASNSCLVVQGNQNVWFATGGATVARVFRSSDQGQTWSVADTPMHPANASSGVFSLAFHDAKNGIAVGGDYAHPESSGLPSVLITSDGGKTWRSGAPTIPAGMYLSSVAYAPHSRAGSMVAAGIKGLVLASADGTWAKESDENLNAVAYAGPGVIWAVGSKGIVLRKKEKN